MNLRWVILTSNSFSDWVANADARLGLSVKFFIIDLLRLRGYDSIQLLGRLPMTSRITIGFALIAVLLLGCSRESTKPVSAAPEPSDAIVKELVSRAAGMSGVDFMKLIEVGDTRRLGNTLPGNLTANLLFKGQVATQPAWTDDFRMKANAGISPTPLVDILVGGRKAKDQISYASIIWPAYITELKVARSARSVTGSAAFKTDLYSGRVEFTLAPISSDPGWKVTRLAMPGRHLSLQLADDGTWKTASE